ncbi:YlxR family protein [Deinococcus sp. Marseille-Q6407]|uniref:YlxR family protein n=1 Tax=Deinococcus sp. Marseille-Q6407 TaxID=2969223 RepID=UPI0021BE2F01|nr:DUF448 domain-containing protein [Deinococcus sp. Marseille-Q6407]
MKPQGPAGPAEQGSAAPQRTCVACRRTRPQAELLRLTRKTGGGWELTGPGARRLPGRGFYLCADNPACWNEKKLRRTFGAAAPALAGQLTQAQADQPATEAPHSQLSGPARL